MSTILSAIIGTRLTLSSESRNTNQLWILKDIHIPTATSCSHVPHARTLKILKMSADRMQGTRVA
jgi:hypothetical protein